MASNDPKDLDVVLAHWTPRLMLMMRCGAFRASY